MPEFGSGGAGTAVVAPGRRSTRASRRALAACGAVWAAFAAIFPAQAADAYAADAVKAEFLFRFASYVEWPADLPAGAPFTIAVGGADGVFDELQRLMPGRTVQNRPVDIRKVTAASELARVQILYVPSHARESSRALLAAAVGRPILIVTDEAGGLANGGIVNFVQADRHVRFEISLTAAERSRLKIDSGLLSVAAHVEGVRPRADTSCWQTSFGLAPACGGRAALVRNDAGALGRSRARRAEGAS